MLSIKPVVLAGSSVSAPASWLLLLSSAGLGLSEYLLCRGLEESAGEAHLFPLPFSDALHRTRIFGHLDVGRQQRYALDDGLCDEQAIKGV